MLFDSTAIILSLMASVITKWEANKFYSYGYGRVETLTGFINALALVFASGNIMWEAIERLISPTGDLGTENLLVVSVLGLLVNIVGIFAFDHGGAHGHAGHSHGDDHGHCHGHGHDHDHGHNPLMEGMLLHIISDALGSVGVIISSLLIEYFGITTPNSRLELVRPSLLNIYIRPNLYGVISPPEAIGGSSFTKITART